MCNVEGPPLKKQRMAKLPSGEPMPIYLDYNATTPLCQEAWLSMANSRHVFGNPSSSHPFGLEGKYEVEHARLAVGEAIGATDPAEEILFTSGGTEANNLAIVGSVMASREEERAPEEGDDTKGGKTKKKKATPKTSSKTTKKNTPQKEVIVSSNFEHPAVEKVLQMLSKEPYNFIIFRCPVNDEGLITQQQLEGTIRRGQKEGKIVLVTIMHANNEVGSVQDIRQLVRSTKALAPKALFHTDAAQSLGKVPVHVEDFGVDLLSICSHKFYGPKGVGALYVRKGTKLKNVTFGADHEKGLRPGTENILLDVGMATALTTATKNLEAHAAQMSRCREVLFETMQSVLAKKGMKMEINGTDKSFAHCLPNTLSVALVHEATQTYISASRLIVELGHIVAMSAGSACHSTAEPGKPVHISGTLRAIGCSDHRAMGTLRLSTGRGSTEDDMRRAGKFIAIRAVQQLADW